MCCHAAKRLQVACERLEGIQVATTFVIFKSRGITILDGWESLDAFSKLLPSPIQSTSVTRTVSESRTCHENPRQASWPYNVPPRCKEFHKNGLANSFIQASGVNSIADADAASVRSASFPNILVSETFLKYLIL